MRWAEAVLLPIGVFVVIAVLQLGVAFVLVRAPAWADVLGQGAIGAVVVWWFSGWWLAGGPPWRRWLATIALAPFWGSLVALGVLVVLRVRLRQERVEV